jgi:hypothetical protein
MRAAAIILTFLFSSYCDVLAQSTRQGPKYMQDGLMEHHGSSATVSANDPRPLLQAARAVAEEYGWVVDFEDPLYDSKYDAVDTTDAEWKAANPNSKGTLSVAGRAFQSSFTEPVSVSADFPEASLKKIVDDYNKSGNPGRFELSKESDRRFTITGTESSDGSGSTRPKPPLLDTQITIPIQTRNGTETFNLFLQTLSDAARVKVVHGSFMDNLLQNSSVKTGGDSVSARYILSSIVSQLNSEYELNWTLFYDLDSETYFLNIWPAMIRTAKDAQGRLVFSPLERRRPLSVTH